jgi:hypothetical protein
MNKLRQSGMKVMRHRNVVIIICLIILIGGGIIIIHKRNVTHQAANINSAKAPISSGLAGAVGFTKKVYTEELAAWDSGDATFINSHRSWFTKNFLAYTVDYHPTSSSAAATKTSTFLFCNKPSHKPNSYAVTRGNSLTDTQTALVYVNSKNKGRPEVVNLPVQLKAVKGSWAIDLINCTSI